MRDAIRWMNSLHILFDKYDNILIGKAINNNYESNIIPRLIHKIKHKQLKH